jgi:tartrate-resistant acid phosphatase type 5
MMLGKTYLMTLLITHILICTNNVFAAAPLSLVAIGDWGGESDANPTTAAQIAAAGGMSKISKKIEAEGILLLGDNFYSRGVETNTSTRFNTTFEQVYPEESFSNLPFYVLAGNHDHKGNVEAQIDYHDMSDRWHFPKLYYKLCFNFTSTSGVQRTVDIIMIDTVTLIGECLNETDFPGCPLFLRPEKVNAANMQWIWLETQLTQSTADFLWVAGHYPIYSAGSDGTTPLLVTKLLPMLKTHNAHYISGHDHMHEHIISENVHMFVTGPGRMCCYDPVNIDTVPKNDIKFMVSGTNGTGANIGPKPKTPMLSGFSSMEFDDDVTIKMYKEDGTVIWAPKAIHRRVIGEQ